MSVNVPQVFDNPYRVTELKVLEVLWTVARLAQYLWFLKNVSMLNRPKSIKQLD